MMTDNIDVLREQQRPRHTFDARQFWQVFAIVLLLMFIAAGTAGLSCH
jgi:hypothetical protein